MSALSDQNGISRLGFEQSFLDGGWLCRRFAIIFSTADKDTGDGCNQN
jgi:hypothetical protein